MQQGNKLYHFAYAVGRLATNPTWSLWISWHKYLTPALKILSRSFMSTFSKEIGLKSLWILSFHLRFLDHRNMSSEGIGGRQLAKTHCFKIGCQVRCRQLRKFAIIKTRETVRAGVFAGRVN